MNQSYLTYASRSLKSSLIHNNKLRGGSLLDIKLIYIQWRMGIEVRHQNMTI